MSIDKKRSKDQILKFSQYQEARVKLINTKLNKLTSAAKNKTEAILRFNKKNYEDEELLEELF